MDLHRLADLLAGPIDRIEGRLRLLEDHGDLLATNLGHLIEVEIEQVAPTEPDLALDQAPRIRAPA